MIETKYGYCMKSLNFQDCWPFPFRQEAVLTSREMGIDVNVEIRNFVTAGKIGNAPYEAEVHDYDEVIVFVGSDTVCLSELGAEVEVCLGEEKERHMISSASIIFIPRGLPHFPANIIRMSQPFICLNVAVTKDLKSTPVLQGVQAGPVVGWGGKYRKLVSHLEFARKSAWHYGPANPDDSGGSIAVVNGKEFGFTLMVESISRAPYRFGPIPDKPHDHPYNEFAIALGSDMNDMNYLGAQIETGMGPEMERHVLTSPHLILLPQRLPHGPLAITKLEKPFLFFIVKPYGLMGEGQQEVSHGR